MIETNFVYYNVGHLLHITCVKQSTMGAWLEDKPECPRRCFLCYTYMYTDWILTNAKDRILSIHNTMHLNINTEWFPIFVLKHCIYTYSVFHTIICSIHWFVMYQPDVLPNIGFSACGVVTYWDEIALQIVDVFIYTTLFCNVCPNFQICEALIAIVLFRKSASRK